MKLYRVGIVGYFAKGKSKAGGQEAKTCAIADVLKQKYGEDYIYEVDTTDWKKHPARLLLELIRMCITCKNVIMLPAQNSLKVYVPVLLYVNRFYHRRIIYSVVGGWLPNILQGNRRLTQKIKKLSVILVETTSMKEKLKILGVNNVDVVPNFKNLEAVSPDELEMHHSEPYKICTFSRVMKEKGIEDAIEAVKAINTKFGAVKLELHIYGKIDDAYVEKFNFILKSIPTYIQYMGMVEPHESVSVLRIYAALLFPTHYYTEGVPGTIIDAYMSGVPVITALWGNCQDVFVENLTGWGYEFDNRNGLYECLLRMIDKPQEFFCMKHSALEFAKKFTPSEAMGIIGQYIE